VHCSCAAEAALVMTCRSARSPLPSITARPSAAEKARFTRLAERAGMSESALALMAIRAVLDPDRKAPSAATPATGTGAATDRVTIRLRPGDGAAIARRAAQRGMKVSTYLAALARAHVAANPPLAATELATLKQSIVVLAGLGRLLAQTARNPALTGTALEDLRQNLNRARTAVAALEQRTHALARAALISWESRSD
jgi:hypothetical protein